MSLKRINCYHHSLWLSVNLLVAKKNYLLLSPYCFSIDFCSGNLRVKLDSTLDSIWPFQYDDVHQETLYSKQWPMIIVIIKDDTSISIEMCIQLWTKLLSFKFTFRTFNLYFLITYMHTLTISKFYLQNFFSMFLAL